MSSSLPWHTWRWDSTKSSWFSSETPFGLPSSSSHPSSTIQTTERLLPLYTQSPLVSLSSESSSSPSLLPSSEMRSLMLSLTGCRAQPHPSTTTPVDGDACNQVTGKTGKTGKIGVRVATGSQALLLSSGWLSSPCGFWSHSDSSSLLSCASSTRRAMSSRPTASRTQPTPTHADRKNEHKNNMGQKPLLNE